MKIEFTKQELINAIKKIDNNPKLKTGRQSSTYDLIFDHKKYPPILVLSVANELKNGKELTLLDFGNSIETPFKILRDNGFKINAKLSQMKPNLKDFIKVANEQTTGQGTTDSATIYARENKEIKEGLKTEISFGVGRASAIPWIAFTGFNQNVKNGIYPVYLYYKDYKKIILAYGVSETNKPLINWSNLESKQTIKDYFENQFSKKPDRYGNSYIYKIYDVESLPTDEILELDLKNIIKSFKDQFKNVNTESISVETLLQEDFPNLKEEFVDWFIKLDGSKHNYFSGQFSSSRDRLINELEKTEEVYEEEFDSKIFSTDDGDIESLIKRLEHNLSKNEGLFYEYSSGKSNHRPRAIIGKNNYITFLHEKLEGTKNITSQTKKINISSNQIDFDIKSFLSACKNAGLVYTDKLISRFVSSLLTKPFVILTGLSGSGKTKLAQAFVQWICQEKSQYRIIPVGADWTNREPLLGYPNALKPEEYVKPDSGVIDLILQANSNPELPHFLILDEMNLSHVERYFADFLSVMESNEPIPLYAEGTVNNGVPSKLKVPSNLFIIGTVNIDETTNMFSPKVLDRANTIEFRVSKNEMESFLENIKDLNMAALIIKGATMSKAFLDMAAKKSFATEDLEDINQTLIKFFGELTKTGAEFGYRSANEILRLIHQLSEIDKTLTINEKIDVAIMQKLLPKLHGSRRKLTPILETLGSFCVSSDFKIVKDVFENQDFDFNTAEVLYSLSLEKITRMYKGAIDNGFTSYAEA